ncbi:MAG TPA: ribose-phosphate diphosphokinase [Acidimicrobiales bacterium]|nr:ribose-phosphate diphosphokinase [Acidimicrobiales bacterium]
MLELVPTKHLQIYGGRAHPDLAAEIAACLDIPLGDPGIVEFANSEVRPTFGESIRGADVFILQTHACPVNESLMEQAIMIDAAKRASAKRITAICPYYGYGRQDRKAKGREPITAKLVADVLKVAGADRIVSVDLHSGQIQGFFDGPFDHLSAMPVLDTFLRANLGDDDFVFVAPDQGRTKVADRYAEHFSAEMASVFKRRARDRANVVEAVGVMGEVSGRRCVLVDDMIDTAGTICAAAEILVEHGATEVWALATHGVLSGPAVDRLKNSVLTKVVVTNTLPIPSDKQFDKLEVLSVAGVIADAIRAVFEDASVSELFGGENQI